MKARVQFELLEIWVCAIVGVFIVNTRSKALNSTTMVRMELRIFEYPSTRERRASIILHYITIIGHMSSEKSNDRVV